MFLATLALKSAKKLSNLKIIEEEMVAVYAYGLELLYSAVVTVMGMVLISILVKMDTAWLWFLCAFIPLRLTAGGYHATSHFRCLMLTWTLFFLCLFLVHILPVQIWPAVLTVIVLVMVNTILFLVPVATRTKPMTDIEKLQNRNRALTIMVIDCMLWGGAMLLTSPKSIVATTYFLGVLSASISLIAGKIRNSIEGREHYEETA